MLLLQFKILPGLHSVGHTSSSRLSSRRHRTWCWTWWRRPSWRRSCWRTGQGWPTPSWTLFCRFTQWHLMYLALCRSSNVVRLKIFAPSWCRWNSLSSAGLALARGPGGKWLMGCLSYLFLSQISLIFICNCFLFGQAFASSSTAGKENFSFWVTLPQLGTYGVDCQVLIRGYLVCTLVLLLVANSFY